MKASDYSTNDFAELSDDQIITALAKDQNYFKKFWKIFIFLQGSLYHFEETGQMIWKVKKIPTFTSFCGEEV